MAVFGMILFWLFIAIGFFSIPFGIAGTFILVADVALYQVLSQTSPFSWAFIALLLGIAVLIEVIEGILGSIMARQFGGSKWSMVGAGVGGILGAIWATPLFPVVGTLIGGIVGAFLGTLLVEYVNKRNWHQAFKAGTGALIGAVSAKGLKIVAALIMILMIVIQMKQG